MTQDSLRGYRASEMSRRNSTKHQDSLARRGGQALKLVRVRHRLRRADLVGIGGWSCARLAAVEEGTEDVTWLALLELLDAMGASVAELSAAYAALSRDDRTSSSAEVTAQ